MLKELILLLTDKAYFQNMPDGVKMAFWLCVLACILLMFAVLTEDKGEE